MAQLAFDRDHLARFGKPAVQPVLKGQDGRPVPVPPSRPGTAQVPGPLYWVNQFDQRFYPWGEFQNHSLNCGPSCVCMVMDYARGVILGVDQVLDREYGPGFEGLTYVDHHVQFLKDHGVPTDGQQVGTLVEYRNILQSQVSSGYLTIVLGDFLLENVGHFEVCYGTDEPGQETLWLNPYQDEFMTLSWDGAWLHCQNTGGWVIVPHRGRAAYQVSSESWTAQTIASPVHVRVGPSTSELIRQTVSANTRFSFTQYTDNGEAIDGGDPASRWHYSVDADGWIADAVLQDWVRV
jgi:hypothetical protein